jgi:hypothetical protein
MVIIGSLAVLATVLIGFALRLVDPASTTVIPAEDPYNHMALVREHIRSGTLSSFDESAALYPPGMHALLAAIWVYTGSDLYNIIRFGPVLFGTLGVLGMAILLWRYVGPVGAFVGALGYAIIPEVVFRTTMMSPTAVDLALLPFFLFALLAVAGGRLRWLPVAGLIALFFVFAHPWLLGILAVAGVFFVLMTLIAPGSQERAPTTSVLGLAAVIAIVVGGLGLAMTGCGGYCGPGVSNFLPDFMNQPWVAWLVLLGSILPAIALSAYPHSLDRILPKGPKRPLAWWIKLPISGAIALTIVAVSYPALQQGLPEQVDLARMIGWPVLLISGAGLVLLPFLSSRLAYLGTGIILFTYPMVMYNVFDSPFWPHRTVVFLAIGAVIILGVTAAAVTRWAVAASSALQDTLSKRLRRTSLTQGRSGWSAFALLPAVLVVASIGGAVYTETPEIYPGGWYRLYPECETDALVEMAELLNEDPDALMITGSWEARLVLASMTEDPSRIWFDPAFLLDYNRREDVLAVQANQGGPVHVVLERHTGDKIRPSDLGFLDEPPWQHHDSWCAGMGLERARIEMHTTGGPPA